MIKAIDKVIEFINENKEKKWFKIVGYILYVIWVSLLSATIATTVTRLVIG